MDRVGAQFSERVESETGKLAEISAQVTGSAVEVASLGEAFGAAVQLFSASNDKLATQLERIEAALDKSIARGDEQLSYYVSQAREVVDLSLMSQKQIIEDLQHLASQRATRGRGRMSEDFDAGVDSTAPTWAVFGDLMSVLLGSFVLILVSVIGMQLELSTQLEDEVKQRQEETHRRESLEQVLAGPLAAGRVTLVNGRIGISGSVLFALNSDQLQPEGRELLKSLAEPLTAYLGTRQEILMVSGFTDDQQVREGNRRFADNWDLSAQRALTVTRTLIDAGVPSSSLFAAAFGSEQPVASNADAEARPRTAAWKSRRCRAWPATRPRNRMSDRAQADAGRERDPIPTAQESDQDRQALSAPVDVRQRPRGPPPAPRAAARPPACAWTPGASAAPTAWIPCASVSWKRWRCRPYAGAARALLDQRLAALLDAYAADLERTRPRPAARARAVASAWPRGAGLRRRYAHRRAPARRHPGQPGPRARHRPRRALARRLPGAAAAGRVP